MPVSHAGVVNDYIFLYTGVYSVKLGFEEVVLNMSDDGLETAALRAKPLGAAEVRQSILDAALRLMCERGTTEVPLREIAREANVNHGLVHRHFGTRHDVLIAALKRHSEVGEAFLRDVVDIDIAIDKLWMHPNMAESAKLVAGALLGGVSPESIAEGRALHRLEQLLAEGNAGEPPADVTARVVALSCLILGWGLFGGYLTAIAPKSHQQQLRCDVQQLLHSLAHVQPQRRDALTDQA